MTKNQFKLYKNPNFLYSHHVHNLFFSLIIFIIFKFWLELLHNINQKEITPLIDIYYFYLPLILVYPLVLGYFFLRKDPYTKNLFLPNYYHYFNISNKFITKNNISD